MKPRPRTSAGVEGNQSGLHSTATMGVLASRFTGLVAPSYNREPGWLQERGVATSNARGGDPANLPDRARKAGKTGEKPAAARKRGRPRGLTKVKTPFVPHPHIRSESHRTEAGTQPLHDVAGREARSDLARTAGVLTLRTTTGADVVRLRPAAGRIRVEMHTRLGTVDQLVRPATGVRRFALATSTWTPGTSGWTRPG